VEYVCPAWHTNLTKQQTTSLENIQRRTLQIIASNMPYDEACCLFKLTSLSERRDSLCSKLFRQLVSQSHIPHCLLPAQRGDGWTGWLRSRNKCPTVRARANHFNKKLSYRRGTARCVVSIEILPTATQQCRNYLYDKSWPNRWYEVGDLVGGNAW